MSRSEVEARVQKTFDTVAEGYDHPASFWFDQTARAIVAEARLAPFMQALDLAAGTGKVALALAASEPEAQILGVDLSPGMLAQAKRKAQLAGVSNASFERASFDELDHKGRFDVVTCSFGIFFVEHMTETLTRFGAQAKVGGRVILSTFAAGSFSPFSDAFMRLYREFGFDPPPPPWLRIATRELLDALFVGAKLPAPTTVEHDFSFELADKYAWWDIVYNAGYRGMLQQMTEPNAARFKDRHLTDVDELINVHGHTRLNVRVLVASSTKD